MDPRPRLLRRKSGKYKNDNYNKPAALRGSTRILVMMMMNRSVCVFPEPKVYNAILCLTIFFCFINHFYFSESPADEAEPIVEEPLTPEVAPEAPVEAEAEPEAEAADVSEDEKAEPDLTDEE